MRWNDEPTLRDTFAAAAIGGLLADVKYTRSPCEAAQDAYAYADAMLCERASTTPDAEPATKAEVATGTGHTQSDTTCEPDAWLVLDEKRKPLVSHLWKAPAQRDAKNHDGVVVPLFLAPPPPALTDEEVAAVSGEEREAADSPATWQDECVAVEAAFARSNVRPTWPDDEVANIGPMANAMADEIDRLRDVVRQLTSSLLSQRVQRERDQMLADRETAVVQVTK